MIKCLNNALKIDLYYGINSFIYNLRRLPVFKDLITEEIYKSRLLKHIIGLFAVIIFTCKIILYRFLYFFVIYLIADTLGGNVTKNFIHIFFIFTIIGLFINNRLLNTSTKKYFSIVLFNMDAKKYMEASICFDVIKSLLLNSICFIIMSAFLNYSFDICLYLILICFFARIVGEGLNMLFYKKYKYVWLDNLALYFSILGILLVVSLLPYFGIVITKNILLVSLVLLVVLSIISIIYLIKIDDYKLIFKLLNTKNRVMSSEDNKSYSRQAMVEVKDKDKTIDSKKLKNKKGYDLFNTIFFERHKEILMRSAKKYASIIFVIYVILCFLVIKNMNFSVSVHSFLLNNLAWFVIIMYFINRGAIITQAMFFNCDHAMLTYNFYREPKVILGLFKMRIKTVTLVNLIPALVIGIGNIILLYLSGGSSFITYLSMLIFILCLSVFFSVHHLVWYYLLQPYNKDMKIRKVSYSIVSLITYMISYTLIDFVMSSLVFSVLGIVFTITYICLGLLLVYKFAPSTFRIN